MNQNPDVSQNGKKNPEVNESELALLMDNLPGFAYRCKLDRDWTMLYISKGCLKITGYEPEDFINNRTIAFNDVILPKYRDYLWEKWQNVIKTNSEFEDEYEIMCRDGETRWVWERGKAIFDSNGEVLYLDGFITDITARKRYEMNLAMEEQRFRTIAECSPVPIFIQTEGKFVYINPVARRVLGIPDQHDLYGNEVVFCFQQEDHELIHKLLYLLNVVQQPITESIIVRMLKSDGSSFLAELWAEPIEFAGKRGSLVFFNDITLRDQKDRELRDRDRFFQNSPDLMCAMDLDGAITIYNPAWRDLLGYSDQEIKSTSFVDFIHPEDRNAVINIFSIVRNNAETKHIETRLITKHGSVRWLSWIIIPYPDEKLIFGIARDITDRKLSEQELILSEHRFRNMVQQTWDIISLFDAEGNCLYVSPGVEKTLGYKPEELLHTSGLELIHPQDLDHTKKIVEDFISSSKQEYLHFTFRVIHKDGSVRWLETTISNRLNEPGIRALIINSHDVTEQTRNSLLKEIEARIAQAILTTYSFREFFRLVRKEINQIIDATNFIIGLYDEKSDQFHSPYESDEKNGHPVTWSAADSLSGLVKESKMPLLLKKQDILKYANEGKITLRGARAECWLGVPIMVKDRFLGVMVVQNYTNPNAYNETDKEILQIIANYLSTFILQKEVEMTNLKLSKAVLLNPASIVITDVNGTIEFVNPKFTQLTGYTAEEAIGQNPRIVNSGYHSKEFYQHLWNTILSGQTWQGELLNKKKNGDLYWESATITPVINEEGIITNFIGVKEDITQLKKLLNDLMESKRKAEESDRIKTEFLNNISHEIRTPLNSILGFGEMILHTEIDPSEREHYIKILQSSIQRLLNTITDYMDASLLAAGAMKMKLSTFEVTSLLEKLHNELKNDFTEKKLELILDTEALPYETKIRTDRELLEKVFRKLLSNALKFTDKGTVKFGVVLRNGVFCFCVEDTGIGIDDSEKEKLFKWFSQAYSGTTRQYEGSGLGLNIAKNIVQLLGGELSLDSTPGKGSRFEFTIPQGIVEPSLVSVPDGGKDIPEKPVILIAEDDDYNFFYLNAVLKKYHTEILRAENGKDAVILCQNHPEINLVLMDVKMPVMDGIEAMKQIRKFRKTLPIVAITAYALTGDEQRILAEGFSEYIAKPLTSDQLLEKIKKSGIPLLVRK